MATEGRNIGELDKQLEETIKEIAFLQSYARSLPGDRVTEKAKDALSQLLPCHSNLGQFCADFPLLGKFTI